MSPKSSETQTIQELINKNLVVSTSKLFDIRFFQKSLQIKPIFMIFEKELPNFHVLHPKKTRKKMTNESLEHLTARQIDRQIDRQRDRQVERQIDRILTQDTFNGSITSALLGQILILRYYQISFIFISWYMKLTFCTFDYFDICNCLNANVCDNSTTELTFVSAS